MDIIKYVNDNLHYRITTGEFYQDGKPIHTVTDTNIKVLHIPSYGQIGVARLVWAMHNGDLPNGNLGYLNGNTMDTRIGNLYLSKERHHVRTNRS